MQQTFNIAVYNLILGDLGIILIVLFCGLDSFFCSNCSHQVLVPHIALTLSQSQDHDTLSAVHKLIETFVRQNHEKNNHHLPTSYAAGKLYSVGMHWLSRL